LTNNTKNDHRYVHLDTVTEHKCDRQMERTTTAHITVARIIHLAVHCHYYPLGLQLPSHPHQRLLPSEI